MEEGGVGDWKTHLHVQRASSIELSAFGMVCVAVLGVGVERSLQQGRLPKFRRCQIL